MEETTQPGDGIVQIAYLHSEHVSHSFMDSYRRAQQYDRREGGNILADDPLNMRCRWQIAHHRNFATRLFLDRTQHEWLMFIDTDMGFEPDSIHRLLAAADPATRPVVGGLCFAQMVDQYDGMGGYRFTTVPTMYALGTENTPEQTPSFCYMGAYDDDAVTPVAATGGAFLLIHRSALDKLRAEYGDRWFAEVYDQAGDLVGEDITFCARLLRAGITPHVHTGVKTTHHKEIWLSEADYIAQLGATTTIDTDNGRIQPFVDLVASLTALSAMEHDRDGMLKFPQDLDRYRQIIEDTRPQIIVETGTRTGASARWFADQGLQVVTVDVDRVEIPAEYADRIVQVVGDSIDPAVIARVAELVDGRRAMVCLDSDHSAPHVRDEIDAYGPLVSAGCYLVVEDTIFGYSRAACIQHGLRDMVGSPLDAVRLRLHDNPDWLRDLAIERLSPVSSNPVGYWVRNHG